MTSSKVVRLDEHSNTSWVIQVLAQESDEVFGHTEGEWVTFKEVPAYLTYSPDLVAEHFQYFVNRYPGRELRMHKTTVDTRHEAVYLSEKDVE